MRFEKQTLDYVLPEDKIASTPLAVRHDSKLLVYQDNQITHDQFINLATNIAEGSLLVFNNTKVFHARLHFFTEKGKSIEVFCLEPANHIEPSVALSSTLHTEWICMVGGAKKWKTGQIKFSFQYQHKPINIIASMVQRNEEMFHLAFDWDSDEVSFAEILQLSGELPLPPYMNRKANKDDENRYQTVYAKESGSVAAPTAGLHFTPEVFELLSQKNIQSSYVTLHVGAGTFKPIKSADYTDHVMHEELIDVGVKDIENVLQHLGKVIAVGTTSLRTIESLYWMGVKTLNNPEITLSNIGVKQWEAYELSQSVTPQEALNAVLIWMKKNNLTRLLCKTQIMIIPDYSLRIAAGIITNFHQPKSTLLLIIAAITGHDWEKIYKEALNNNYRFLSYGDSSLLMKRKLP